VSAVSVLTRCGEGAATEAVSVVPVGMQAPRRQGIVCAIVLPMVVSIVLCVCRCRRSSWSGAGEQWLHWLTTAALCWTSCAMPRMNC
jgi:hypothetical protein